MKLIIILLVIFPLVWCQHPRPILNLPSGTIRGHYLKTETGRDFAAFEGIPYAKAPVGKYRFREPQPLKPWRGIWETNYVHTCLQYNHYIRPGLDRVIGSEDCLYINVYTPVIRPGNQLDVIVYIHGGAFMFGGSRSYGPKIIMDRDIIYVNFNYRLGPMGFLSTEDNVVPGNMGLKDQVMALRWIKSNIQFFGGNPNSITLTGMSAGGASVHLHYMSPMSTGLFNRGFSLSGTALNPWVLTENALQKAMKLARLVGCDTYNTRDMVECMRHRPGSQIVQNVKHFFGFLYNPFSPFGVVVEPQVQTVYSKEPPPPPFLTEHPYTMLQTGRIQHLPWITSVVQAEGLYPAAEFLAEPIYLEHLAARWPDLAPHILDYNFTVMDMGVAGEKAMLAEKVLKEYLQNRPIMRDTFNELVQLIGDRLFVADSQNAARIHAQKSSFPVYYYHFKYRGAHSKSETLSRSDENFGAAHGDDTIYVLSTSIKARTTEKDIQISEMLLGLWTSYANTGVPHILNSTWQPVSKNSQDPLKYLEIVSPTEIKETTNDDLGKNKFWLSLPFRENARLQVGYRDEL